MIHAINTHADGETTSRRNRSIARYMFMALFFLFAAMPQYARADGARVNWTIKAVRIYDGSCEVVVAFRNEGDMAAELTKVQFNLHVRYNGKDIFTVFKEYPMYGLYVWGGSVQHTFTIYGNQFKKEQNYNGNTPYGWYIDNVYFWWDNRRPIGM